MKKLLAALALIPVAAYSQIYEIPIECGSQKDLDAMLVEYKEVPTFEMTTIRIDKNEKPMKIHTTLYVNTNTKSWTLIEYFPGDKTYCIISSGGDIRPAASAIKGKPV